MELIDVFTPKSRASTMSNNHKNNTKSFCNRYSGIECFHFLSLKYKYRRKRPVKLCRHQSDLSQQRWVVSCRLARSNAVMWSPKQISFINSAPDSLRTKAESSKSEALTNGARSIFTESCEMVFMAVFVHVQNAGSK